MAFRTGRSSTPSRSCRSDRIDLDPAPGGTVGQIIEYIVDDDARPLVAKSFAELLALYFAQAQTDALDFDDDADD